MFDHASLHDPYYWEPYDYEDRDPNWADPKDFERWEEESLYNSSTIDDLIEKTGGAFLYNPDNNGEIFLIERDFGCYWVERHRILSRNGDKLVVTLIHLQDCFESLEEVAENYPEWTQQEVYGKDLLS